MRRFLICAIATLATVIGGSSVASAAIPAPDEHAGTSAQSDLLAQINAYRAANGRQPLTANGPLTSAATWMASDMATKNYFAHTSSDGRSPTQRMSAFGYPASSSYTGEDLAAGYSAAGAVLAGWIASPAHNAVLLNPNFDGVGIGVVYNATSSYQWYWTADFGGSGGTIRVLATPAPPVVTPAAPAPPVAAAAPAARAVAVPRGAPEVPAAPVDAVPAPGPEAEALPSIADRVWWRRIDHLFAVFALLGSL